MKNSSLNSEDNKHVYHLPESILARIRARVIVPLKEAMRIKEYHENERNYKFHVYKKIKGSKKQKVFRSYSFKVTGTLRHEMYIKPLNPKLIKSLTGEKFNYRLIIKPNRHINLDDDRYNNRSIELIIFFRKAYIASVK
ncbi:MAG: hypothetical protein JWO32_646 [Bacteroidetes bacterium]|nr:hypothetical protein [Bacteroidota bacterium]